MQAHHYLGALPKTGRLNPSSLPTSPIRAAPRGDAIRCLWFWPSPPVRSCAACVATYTRPSRTGPSLSPRRESVSTADAARAPTASESIFRDFLIRRRSVHLDHALQRWNAADGKADDSLAIDNKAMCNAIDRAGRQALVMGLVGRKT